MYSNTQPTHKLNLTLDWVLIFCYDEHHQESQYILVTETHGPLRGKRVIRGQEAACDIFIPQKEISKILILILILISKR
ncbi:MAG: DNA polymerase (family 10) [Colwellia sp.]|jgi:DNA polymerase (family 10)